MNFNRPKRVSDVWRAFQVATTEHRWSDAEDALAYLYSVHPNDSAVTTQMILVFLEQGKQVEAARVYLSELRSGERAKAINAAVNEATFQNDEAKVFASLLLASRAHESISPNKQLGIYFAKFGKQNKLEIAVIALEQAYQTMPDDTAVVSTLAWVLTQLDQYEAGEQLLQSAMERNPTNLILRRNYGTLLFDRGMFQESITVYEELLPHLSNDPIILKTLGYTLLQQGHQELSPQKKIVFYTRAADLLEKTVKFDTTDWSSCTNLAHALYYSGRIGRAIEIYKALLLRESENAEIYYYLGRALSGLGLYMEAINALTTAQQLSAKYQTAVVSLLETAHNPDEAMIVYDEWVYRAMQSKGETQSNGHHENAEGSA